MLRLWRFVKDTVLHFARKLSLWFQDLLVPRWFSSYLAESLAGTSISPGITFDLKKITWDTRSNPEAVMAREGILVAQTNLDKQIARESVERIREAVIQLEGGEAGRGQLAGDLRAAPPDTPYGKLAEAGEPVAVFRDGVDAGMVDIFHADKLVPALDAEIHRIVDDWGVTQLLEELNGSRYRLRNFNVYLNRSVSSTRGWHVDSYGVKQFKVFFYLTDVNDSGDGPYCYVPGTAPSENFARVNQVLSRVRAVEGTDVSIFPSQNALMLLGGVGTMVASNQSGAHRGHPQMPGRERCIVALNFIPA